MSAPASASGQYTDSASPSWSETSAGIDDVIPVSVFVPISIAHGNPHHTKPSFIDRMKDIKNDALPNKQSLEKGRAGESKIVYMPRTQYLKYFARDKDGTYIGTEPERTWTNEELDRAFGIYQTLMEKKPGGHVPDSMMKGLSEPER